MYLRGMGEYEYNDDEYVIYDDWGIQTTGQNFPVTGPGPVPSGQPGGFNWSQLLNTAINTWGQIEMQDARNEAARRQATTPLRYPAYPGYPSSSPFPGYPGYPAARSGTLFGLTPGTLLLLAAAGVGVFMLSDKR